MKLTQFREPSSRNMPSQSQENDPTNRLRNFKNKGKDCDEMRRRRNEVSIELRKAKKDDQLQKRRNITIDEEATSPLQDNNVQIKSPLMSITDILKGMQSQDEQQQLIAVQAARKTLSREQNPPIDDMIRAGVVPYCVRALENFNNPALQFEAAWALTNVASGTSEQTSTVVKAGAVPRLVRLLGPGNPPNVVEQSVWALGNIAGDGPSNRDLVLTSNALPFLLELVTPDTPVALLRNIVWTLSNLCRNKNPPPPFESVKPCLPVFCKLLHYTDNDVIADVCWALSYLTDGTNDKIQAVVGTGLVPRLVQLLDSREVLVLTPVLRTVGNIVTGNDQQTDAVLQSNVLPRLGKLLGHSRPNLVKESAWTLSNITAGNPEQIQQVINCGLIQPLIRVLREGDYKSQKEAAWAVTNITSGGSIQQLSVLVQEGALHCMCMLLDCKDHKCVKVVMDGIVNILATAEKTGDLDKVALLVEECGGLDKIENLQNHENEEIYQKALSIIDTYFSSGEPDDPNLAPQQVNGQLSFNTGAVPDGGFSF
ncbi:hypothetical protein FOCC_FOCC015049 [Frankliniella occidentalis]|nr:hypothetical protein FOCC_FOCC015049 [Frankliniella occidentalis]